MLVLFFQCSTLCSKKTRSARLPKSNIINISDRSHGRVNVLSNVPSTFLFLMQYIKESHLQATKTQLKISVVRTNKTRSLTFFLKKNKTKQPFSSELKCLHYSDTNGRNDNIINIRIIIIHFGLSPVQYNNKQNSFSRYCFWRHSWMLRVYIYIGWHCTAYICFLRWPVSRLSSV